MKSSASPAETGIAGGAPRTLPAWAPGGIVASAIVLFVVENWTVRAPIDDAYIFYRYAQNLVNGDGLVYNVGERVEGFTSLLWTLLVAAGVAAGGDAVAVGHWLGVGCGALVLWLTYAYASFGLVASERAIAALSAWLLVLSLPFALWATSGLETPLFVAAVLVALIAEGRSRPGLAVLASGVAAVVRPEGILLGAVVFAFLFWRATVRRRVALFLLAGYLLGLLLLTAFRLIYFGAPLPNTFYAKVGGVLPWWGAYYVGRFVVQVLIPMVWPGTFVWRDRYLTLGIAWTGCVLISVLAVGGDAFHHSRFFVPALPVLCTLVVRGAIQARRQSNALSRFAVLSIGVCAVWFAFGTIAGLVALIVAALESWSRGRGWKPRAAFVAVSLLLAGGSIYLAGSKEPAKLDGQTQMNLGLMARFVTVSTRWAELEVARAGWSYVALLSRRTAQELDARPPDDKLVATLGIGALGFHSKARILDLLGLVDRTIARSEPTTQSGTEMTFPGHQRTNSRYVLSRKPDYILIPKDGTTFFRLPSAIELWRDPEFERSYDWDPAIGGYRRRNGP